MNKVSRSSAMGKRRSLSWKPGRLDRLKTRSTSWPRFIAVTRDDRSLGVLVGGVPLSSGIGWAADGASSSTSTIGGATTLTFGAASPSSSAVAGGASLDSPTSALTEGTPATGTSAGGSSFFGSSNGAVLGAADGAVGGRDDPLYSSRRAFLCFALAVSPAISFLLRRPVTKKSRENFITA